MWIIISGVPMFCYGIATFTIICEHNISSRVPFIDGPESEEELTFAMGTESFVILTLPEKGEIHTTEVKASFENVLDKMSCRELNHLETVIADNNGKAMVADVGERSTIAMDGIGSAKVERATMANTVDDTNVTPNDMKDT